MKNFKAYVRVLVTGVLLSAGPALVTAHAQDPGTTKTDNTKVNKRDRAKSEKTADQQGMNSSDRELTQKIRKSIIAEKSLSTYAHNVKIVTKNGAVTLKGPVRTDEEKATIESKAKEIAGADKVTSQITVQPKKAKA
jgi:osmotically-inducible protein OsmY